MKLLYSCSFLGIGAGFLLRLLTGLAVHFWGLRACMAWSFFGGVLLHRIARQRSMRASDGKRMRWGRYWD